MSQVSALPTSRTKGVVTCLWMFLRVQCGPSPCDSTGKQTRRYCVQTQSSGHLSPRTVLHAGAWTSLLGLP